MFVIFDKQPLYLYIRYIILVYICYNTHTQNSLLKLQVSNRINYKIQLQKLRTDYSPKIDQIIQRITKDEVRMYHSNTPGATYSPYCTVLCMST